MQQALDALWAPFQQLFAASPDEALVVQSGIVPDLKHIQAEWKELVRLFLDRCGLVVPHESTLPAALPVTPSPHMEAVIAELQEVSRIAPHAVW